MEYKQSCLFKTNKNYKQDRSVRKTSDIYIIYNHGLNTQIDHSAERRFRDFYISMATL